MFNFQSPYGMQGQVIGTKIIVLEAIATFLHFYETEEDLT